MYAMPLMLFRLHLMPGPFNLCPICLHKLDSEAVRQKVRDITQDAVRDA
jgi:hypothetical protein